MNKDAHRVRQKVTEVWQAAIYGLQQMSQASSVLPRDGYEVFRFDTNTPADQVKLDFGPIVFNVPERPNRRSPDLFVVAKGWLTLQGPDFKQLPYKTNNFGTVVGYFRQKAQNLEHVYGAHFDMDELKPGHPVFHVQFGSQQAFGDVVQCLFKRDEPVVDRVGAVLGTIRTPTAQMDIFSVIAQICADHLMPHDSNTEAKIAFEKLRRSCDFLVGAAHRLPFLTEAPAAGCYRAAHWYEAPAANA